MAAWEALPGGLQVEVGSPFCFLCEQAQRLVVPQQMKGAHKIYPLEKKARGLCGGLLWGRRAPCCGAAAGVECVPPCLPASP